MEKYQLVSSSLELENIIYNCYGIAFNDGKNINTIIRDVSIDKEFTDKIVKKCNLCNASLVHITDIVYDSLV